MILLDTNILSTFAKIQRLDLLFKVFDTEKLYISPNVLEELEKAKEKNYKHADKIFELIQKEKIEIKTPTKKDLLNATELPKSFGPGETDSIAMCANNNWTFVTNEKIVNNYCKKKNIKSINLNHILRALWKLNILTKKEVKNLIKKIEEKDNLIITSKKEILSE